MRIQQLIVGGMNVCCYIVSCEKTGEAVVIDPGGDAEAILAALKEGDLKLKHIVNTHCQVYGFRFYFTPLTGVLFRLSLTVLFHYR